MCCVVCVEILSRLTVNIRVMPLLHLLLATGPLHWGTVCTLKGRGVGGGGGGGGEEESHTQKGHNLFHTCMSIVYL